jgi:membrane-associated phospholipid phosphatase
MVKREELYPTLSRTSPVVFFYLTILNCIIAPSYNSFYLFICYCSILGSNWIIKHLLIKPIYGLLNRTSLPILGIGSRPPKANGCQFILDNIPSTSYGMPSGHSQMSWAIATYIICKIINHWYNHDKNNKVITTFGYIWLILSCVLVLFVAAYISYSRVYIEGCHTIQQVIIGGLLGVVSGFLIYYFENDAVNLMSKIY